MRMLKISGGCCIYADNGRETSSWKEYTVMYRRWSRWDYHTATEETRWHGTHTASVAQVGYRKNTSMGNCCASNLRQLMLNVARHQSSTILTLQTNANQYHIIDRCLDAKQWIMTLTWLNDQSRNKSAMGVSMGFMFIMFFPCMYLCADARMYSLSCVYDMRVFC